MPTLADLVLDVPLCAQNFGHYLQISFTKGQLELSDLPGILEPLKENEEADLFKVLAAFLNFTSEAQGADKAKEAAGKIDWPSLIPADALKRYLEKNVCTF